ncbi:MAG: tetratricopeptide repeat protein [Fibrobacter sp.]|jgi:tetratricopeptide (TPR) repeat protein|nr:tetratricopeptide repeat protein [Fibrobacter sp.]
MSDNSQVKDFFSAHGTKIGVAIAVVLLIVVAAVHYFENRRKVQAAHAELMGQGMAYLYAGKSDSAYAEFETLMANGQLEGLALAKAALLAGNLKFQNGYPDEAAVLFQKSLDFAGDVALIRSGAMMGSAAVAMEKKDYAAAVGLLEKFVKEFGSRTGNLAERYSQEEGADVVPTVPDALWKLTLIYREMGENKKAQETAEKILKIYGDNANYADKARKFLATI